MWTYDRTGKGPRRADRRVAFNKRVYGVPLKPERHNQKQSLSQKVCPFQLPRLSTRVIFTEIFEMISTVPRPINGS